MEKFKIPHSDIETTRIAFGAWAIIGGFNWGHQEEKDSQRALRAAFDLGITLFDTAKMYGDGKSEAMIAKALGDVRDKIVIATKALPEDFEYSRLKKDCEERLRILNTDYIDLYQLHWPNWQVPIEEPIRALTELKQEGKIRAFGVSNFGPEDMKDALLHSSEISTNQVPYNLIWRAIEYNILPICQQEQIPILCYSPIMQGILAGKFSTAEEVPDDRARTRHFSKDRPLTRHGEAGQEQETFRVVNAIREIAQKSGIPMVNLSMAWLLSRPAVGSILVGARNAQQVEQNVRAASINVDPSILEELTELTTPLKHLLGANPDMWASESRYR